MLQRTLREATWQTGRDFVAIYMSARLKYLFITMKLVALEKVSFGNREFSETVD